MLPGSGVNGGDRTQLAGGKRARADEGLSPPGKASKAPSPGNAAQQPMGEVVDLTADSDDERNDAAAAAAAEDAAFRAELARFTAQQEELQQRQQQAAAAPAARERPGGGRGGREGPALPPALHEDIRMAAEGGMDVLKAHRFLIQPFLKKRADCLYIRNVEENPHSRPGTPLYERFVKAWATVRDFHVELVFHGTPEKNIESICRQGLDPKRRAGQAAGPGEYFGEEASISVGYCRGGSKMLVFAALVDKTGLTHRDGTVTVIHRPDFHLPLFTLTFDPAAFKLPEMYGGGAPAGYAVAGGGGRAFAPAGMAGALLLGGAAAPGGVGGGGLGGAAGGQPQQPVPFQGRGRKLNR